MREPQTWFTADPHYGHERIIELAKRPFDTVKAMDESMIELHNIVVKPGDAVWCLGDFAIADHMPYLERLNGNMHLVKGNHDHSKRVNKAIGSRGWQSVSDIKHLTLPCGTMLVLCHYAMRVWNRSHYGSIHLYGHSHGSLSGDSQSCDVGVDAWNFRPVSITEIKARLALLPKRTEPDHHQAKSSLVA